MKQVIKCGRTMPRVRRTVVELALHPLRYFAAFGIGVAGMTQTGVNNSLAAALGHPLRAAFLAFVIGTGLLGILCLPGPRLQPLFFMKPEKEGGVPWWTLVGGGVIGGIVIPSVIFLVEEMGFEMLYICLVTGQLLMSLALDRIGFLGLTVRELNAFRLGGVLLAVAGACLAAYEELDVENKSPQKLIPLCFVSTFIGSGWPVHAAVNRKLSIAVPNAFRAAFISFSVSTLVLSIPFTISMAAVDKPYHPEDTDWWMWFGNVFGSTIIFGAIFLAKKLGLSAYFMCIISGQLACGLVFDAAGAFGVEKEPANATRVIGMLLAFAGAGLNALSTERRMRRVKSIRFNDGDDLLNNDSVAAKNGDGNDIELQQL